MRTTSGWLALLLTAGIGLAPGVARAQYYEVPFADPQIPLPIGHDRLETGGFYVAAEFVYLRQNVPLHHQQIAQRGIIDIDGTITRDLNTIPGTTPAPVEPGRRYGTFAPALFADDVGAGSYQPGFVLHAGWRFQNGTTVDFNWMHLVEAKYGASASILPPTFDPGQLLEETFLFSPVFNFPNDFAGPRKLPPGVGTDNAAYGIWNGSTQQQIQLVQRFDRYEINVRVPLCELPEFNTRHYVLVGPRIDWIWERFTWRTTAVRFDGLAGPDDQAKYTNSVSNRLYGVHLGMGHDWYIGNLGYFGKGFAMTADFRGAAYANAAKFVAKYELGDRSVGSKRGHRDTSFVPEVEARVGLTWYPIEAVQIRAGYNIMSYFNTFSSRNPVDFNYGSVDPQYDRQYRLFHGFDIGIAIIF